jgi:hypothetical protein
MEKNMKKITGLFLMVTTLTLFSTAQAGLKSGYEVSITTSGTITTAVGSMGKARNSADSVQYIFCQVTNGTSGYCAAKTASGTYKSCITSDAGMIATMRSLGVNSHIAFKTDGASTSCYSVLNTIGSHIQPATP